MQEREQKALRQNFAGEKKNTADMHKHENVEVQTNIKAKAPSDTSIQQQISTTADKQNNSDTNQSVNQSTIQDGVSSLFSILPSATDISPSNEPQPKPVKKKKKKPKQRLS